MILKPLENKDDYFKKAKEFCGVFASKEWLSIYGERLSFVGIYRDDIQLIGGFYFLKVKKYGFSFIKLPPYTPHCGLFFISDGKNKSSLNSFSKEVMTEVCAYIARQNATLTVLAFPSYIQDLQPFIWAKYKVVPNYTYRINLQNSFEHIASNFDSKNRNAIAKALKEGVETNVNTLSKQSLYDFFLTSLSTTNATIYKKELKNVFFNFSNTNNSFSMEATKNNELLGVVFCVYDTTTCYYLLGGIHKNTGVQGVNNLLIQKSIQKAKELGCTVFDFEGSMLKGVEKFFRAFGPDMFTYFTANKARLPLELMLKFKKRELF